MHLAAYNTGKLFFDTYCTSRFQNLKVVEIGSQNVNGSLREVITPSITEYVGVDFAEGNGVDIVLDDPYKFPFEDNTFDVLVTSSCFEHSEMFWMSFLEGIRILKPSGVMYCNAPSNWMCYHRYPVDCWRFYPDAGKGLETWAKYCNYNTMVLESFITPPNNPSERYADWCCVFLKDANYIDLHTNRMIDTLSPVDDYSNGFRFPANRRFPNGWDNPDTFDIMWDYKPFV